MHKNGPLLPPRMQRWKQNSENTRKTASNIFSRFISPCTDRRRWAASICSMHARQKAVIGVIVSIIHAFMCIALEGINLCLQVSVYTVTIVSPCIDKDVDEWQAFATEGSDRCHSMIPSPRLHVYCPRRHG